MMEAIVKRGHEIGLHGYMHEKLAYLDGGARRGNPREEHRPARTAHGLRPSGYRAPWFETNPWTTDLLARHGVRYCASEMGDDVPYTHPNGLVEIPGQWMLEDWEQFAFNADPAWGFIPENCAKVYDLWWREFEAMHDFGCCFVLTLHPWLSGRPSRVRLLEDLVNAMQARGRVWFARGSEIAEYVRDHPKARREIDFDAQPPAAVSWHRQVIHVMIAATSSFESAFSPLPFASRTSVRTAQRPLTWQKSSEGSPTPRTFR